MANALADLSNELAGVVERTGPGVVRVEGRRRGPASGAVWSSDAVVAASHTLEWDEGIDVGLPDGRTATATLVGRDPTTDLAVLRVADAALAAPQWSDPDGLRVGHLVVGVSRPGRTARAALGIVSALAAGWRAPTGARLEHYLQTDIALHPGFSGSLLADSSGRAIAVNTAGLLRGASLAVTAPTVRRVVEALLAHGHVRRGYLGIGTYPVRLSGALAESLAQKTALLIVSVEPDSPAAQAGILLGDALVAFDGHAVAHPADLLPLLDGERIGAQAAARLVRAGEVREVVVVVGVRGSR
jgi:S1-C subfamily serine protease